VSNYYYYYYYYYYKFILTCCLVIRWQSSGKSRFQQQIKAIYPSTLQMMCEVLISVTSVVLWPTDLGATEGSDVIPPQLFLMLQL